MFESDKSAATDEQNVRRVYLNEFLMRMLAASLRGNVGNRSFYKLKECLLYTFTRNVPGDGRTVAFSADFVDFIDVHDPAFGTLDIIVRCLKELENDVFNIFSDVARFREGGGVGQGEGHVQEFGQGLGQ